MFSHINPQPISLPYHLFYLAVHSQNLAKVCDTLDRAELSHLQIIAINALRICTSSRGWLLLCCTEMRKNWWRHRLIFGWPVSGKGHLMWKSNIQGVYPFSTPEHKNDCTYRVQQLVTGQYPQTKGHLLKYLPLLNAGGVTGPAFAHLTNRNRVECVTMTCL